MGFLTVSETIIRTLSDDFNDGAGALSTSKWVLLDVGGGTPQTPRDVDATGTDIREPATPVIAPHVYIIGHSLANPLTCRISMSVKGAGSLGSGAFLSLFRPDVTPAGVRLVSRVGIFDSDNNGSQDSFQFKWRGQTTNVAFAATANTYYRVGIEVDASAGITRGYINPTSASTSAGDSGLEVKAQFDIDSGTLEYDSGTVFAGIGLSGAAASSTIYSGAENILIEEWRLPFSGIFPRAGYYETPWTPYTYFKSTLSLHQDLTNARIA